MGTQTDRWPLGPISRQSEGVFGLLKTLTFSVMMRVALGEGAAADPEAKAQLRALMPRRSGKTMSDAQLGGAIGWMRDTRPEPGGSPFCGGRISWLRADVFAGDRCCLSADPAVSSCSRAAAGDAPAKYGCGCNACCHWLEAGSTDAGRKTSDALDIPVTGLLMGTVTIALGG